MSLILKAIDVQKSYTQSGTKLDVLKGIDLQIKAGEMVAIMGPSGAGKSTLLHILGGLDVPDKGLVQLEGQDLYRTTDEQRAKIRNIKIGFIFQFYHLLPEFTALENVVLPVMIKEDRCDVKSFSDRGLNLLEQVGLKQRVQHKPHELSGGEQQRVAIARSLVNEPQIIFCDEPTGNLDSQSGKEIISLLIELNKKNNQTVVIVTHDEAIAQCSHRVLAMKDGMLIS